jgi:hypothetical protein
MILPERIGGNALSNEVCRNKMGSHRMFLKSANPKSTFSHPNVERDGPIILVVTLVRTRGFSRREPCYTAFRPITGLF